MKTYRH